MHQRACRYESGAQRHGVRVAGRGSMWSKGCHYGSGGPHCVVRERDGAVACDNEHAATMQATRVVRHTSGKVMQRVAKRMLSRERWSVSSGA